MYLKSKYYWFLFLWTITHLYLKSLNALKTRGQCLSKRVFRLERYKALECSCGGRVSTFFSLSLTSEQARNKFRPEEWSFLFMWIHATMLKPNLGLCIVHCCEHLWISAQLLALGTPKCNTVSIDQHHRLNKYKHLPSQNQAFVWMYVYRSSLWTIPLLFD